VRGKAQAAGARCLFDAASVLRAIARPLFAAQHNDEC
jgi:hypothetical protein